MEVQKPSTKGPTSEGTISLGGVNSIVSSSLASWSLEQAESWMGQVGAPGLSQLAFPPGLSHFYVLDSPLLQFNYYYT